MINTQLSYKRLNLAIGLLGLILVPLDVWKCGWIFPPSISESYYLGAIVPFVVIMGALGIVFIFNEGYDNRDKWCNRIAGFAALGVISFPCNSPKHLLIPFPVIHYISAVILFSTFAFMCLIVFPSLRSDKGYTKNKYRRNAIYYISGTLIVVSMLLTGFKVISIFWGEVMMVLSFVFPYLINGEIAFSD